MNVPLIVQLGVNGAVRVLHPICLDAGSVGITSNYAGSYHILSMEQHYDDYVITGRTIGLSPISGFPAAHPYERLTGKIRAPGVTGNIGEAIAAIFARRVLLAEVGDIAHIRPRRPFRKRKSPDYLMRLGRLMPGPFSIIAPDVTQISWPQWWPVESKARSTVASSNSGRKEALKQLVAYWQLLSSSQPLTVGYGLIVTFNYQPPREVRVCLILPSNQGQLNQALTQNGTNIDDSVLRSCLYGC